MPINVDPTVPQNSESIGGGLGASRIRNIPTWILQLLGENGASAVTYTLPPFVSVDHTTGLVTVQGNPTVSTGIATKAYVDAITGPGGFVATATGTNSYVVNLSPAAASLNAVKGFPLGVIFTNGNTGAATINLNALGAVALKKWSNGSLVALGSGDLPAGVAAVVIYDGTQFELVSVASPQFGGGYASQNLSSTSINAGAFSNVTGTLSLTAPASGGPFRLFAEWMSAVASLATNKTCAFRVSDGTNVWALSYVAGQGTDFAVNASGISPVTYANGASVTINVQAQPAVTTTIGGTTSVASLQSYVKGLFVPSN